MANVTTEELETALQDLADGMGLSVKEYVEAGYLDLTTYGQDKAAIEAKLQANTDAISAITEMDDNDVESMAERIAKINAVLSDSDSGELQGILDLINVNIADIAGLRTDVTGLRTDVDAAVAQGNSNATNIDNLSQAVSDNKEAAELAVSDLSGRVDTAESELEVLKGDETVVGSVAQKVKEEADRAKAVSGLTADLTTDEKGNLVGAINEVNTKADEAKSTAESALSQAASNKAELDVINGDDTVDGSIAKAVKDATGGDISDLSDRVTATETAQGADQAAIETLNGDETVEGSVDKKIADANSVLDGRVSATEEEATRVKSILDDSTDDEDNLVKGIVTQTADNTAAIAAEAAARVAELTQTVEDMKAYSDANDLKASAMDMCKIKNKFRGALGLADKSCDDEGL